jgi:hypothetical protein
MTLGRLARWFFVLGTFVAGCSASPSPPSACIDGDKACGVACNGVHPCAAGLYCGSDQLCAKDCTSALGCGSSQHCGSNGKCVAGAAPMSKPAGAGGSSETELSNANPIPLTGGIGGVRVPDMDASSETCQMADVSASRVIPTVILVIDQSGSMTQPFGGGTRWQVLRDFLLKSDGLIASLQTQIRFGLAMYSAVERPDNSGTMECPIVTSVTPKLMNFAAISDIYTKANPLSETPTGDAIDKIVGTLPKPEPDKPVDPVVLILATDGEPDRCEELNPQNGQEEAVTAVKHAFSMGIRTYIISVGDEVSAKHQQDVANAGIGRMPADPKDNAPYWNAMDDTTLRSALTEIIAAQVSCDVTLEGKVQNGNPCDGTVELNGTKLTCKGSDGWELSSDAKHIRLLGKACSDFKTIKDSMVHARFPCTVQVVF